MTEYAKKIEYLASEGGKNEIFYNSSDSHALIVLKNLAKNAKTYIKAICGNMCSEVSNDPEYLIIVEDFLKGDKNRRFKILFDNNFKEEFLKTPIAELFAKYPNQVEIKKTKEGSVHYNNEQVHLTVSDDRAFRCETDINKKIAWGNFNNPTQAIGFSNAFDKFFTSEYSEIVTLQSA